MDITLEPGKHSLAVIETEETVVLRGDDWIVTDLHIIQRTTGKDAAHHTKSRHNWPRNRAALRVVGGRNFRIRNLKVSGPLVLREGETYVDRPERQDLEGQHGVEFVECQEGELHHYECHDVHGDGLFFDDRCQGMSVRYVDIHGVGRHGLGASSGSDLSVKDGAVHGCRRSAIDLEPATDADTIMGVQIARMDFSEYRTSWLACASSRGHVEDVEVAQFTCDEMETAIKGREGKRLRKFRLRDGTGRKRYGSRNGAPIIVEHADYITLTRLYQPLQAKRPSDDPIKPQRLVVARDVRWLRENDNDAPLL